MKKLLLLLFAVMLTALSASAYDFVSNGIYYNITSSTNNTVEVTYRNTNYGTYSGNITIPSTVTYSGKTYTVTAIGYLAFYQSSGLTSVTIPSTVKQIAEDAFYHCTGLTNLTIPNSVQIIFGSAFAHCSNLTTLTIGSNVEYIYEYAFWGCTSLSKITCLATTPPLFDSDSGVEELPFSDETYSEATLYVPKGCKQAYQNADWWGDFDNIVELPFDFEYNGIYYRILSSQNRTVAVTYKEYGGYSGSMTIPSSVSYGGTTYSVTAIGEDAFYNCSGLTNVVIPNTVTTIGRWAFDGCSALTSINLPSNLTTLNDFSFFGCSRLKEVVIPNSVTSIGYRVFYDCYDLEKIVIPASVSSIGDGSFYNCNALNSVTCMATTPPTMGGSEVFSSTTYSTAKLYVPNSSKSAYQSANYWKNFTTIQELAYSFVVNGIYYRITGANTVEVTYKDTNYNTYSGSISIPSSVTISGTTYSVTAIGESAFRECTALTSVSIPNTVTVIDEKAFYGCSGLTNLVIPNTVTTIGRWALDQCTALTSIVIPNSVTTLNDYAFFACTNLKEVVIPNSVTSIGYRVFYNCYALENVVIPASVTSIGDGSFYNCNALKSVTCLATTPPTLGGSSVFLSSTCSSAMLFVPKASLGAYQAADNWKRFTTMKPHLEYALNTGNADVEYQTSVVYPWINVVEGDRVYARSGNKGVHSSTSMLVATVNLGRDGSVSFDFKAWGEGSSWDVCYFLVDGVQKFAYGARQNEWETYTASLTAGTHTLTWAYEKDFSVNPDGDYFAVDNVVITGMMLPGDVDGDGIVGIADVTTIIDIILYGHGVYYPAADINGDGNVGIGDVTALIDMIINN